MSGEGIAEAVNHVEKRIILSDPKGKVGQLLNRVKRARQKCQRGDDKIRHRCQMIEFFRPYAAQKPNQRHQRRGDGGIKNRRWQAVYAH